MQLFLCCCCCCFAQIVTAPIVNDFKSILCCCSFYFTLIFSVCSFPFFFFSLSLISVCNQFSRGVFSMLGAVSPESFDTLHSYSNTFQMPFVTPWFPEKVSHVSKCSIIEYICGSGSGSRRKALAHQPNVFSCDSFET